MEKKKEASCDVSFSYEVMGMEQLCKQIGMPPEATGQILAIHGDPAFSPPLHKLTRQAFWQEGLAELKAYVGEDPGGWKQLCSMLRCALAAKEEYRKAGLSETVYYHTMGCFSRFVREHRESYGHDGFDRGWWTVRQVSCRLLRIGELEYELLSPEEGGTVALHIPTDASLEETGLRTSWEEAKRIISRHFPAYGEAPMTCHSWLLSPVLGELLPPHSNILRFQSSFDIRTLSTPNQGVILWVFKNPKLPPEQYPEDTSLQRALKAFLLGGGTFWDARGVLHTDPFRD